MNIKPLEYHFSKRELLKLLCRKRSLLAKKEHDKLFHKRLLLKKGNQNLDILYKIFPPRNSWIRLDKKERNGKSAIEINSIQLERTVLRTTKKFNKAPTTIWEVKLYEFLDELRVDVLKGRYEVPEPNIVAQFKEKKNGKSIFRPIAHFKYKDRIIISQCNKYLTTCFDPLFLDCSYAFRSGKKDGKSFSHHKAVEDIIEYKKKYLEKDLYVAECDIKKFYDCVNHNIVKDIFRQKINECHSRSLIIDERAINIFISYLDSYTFNHTVRKQELGNNSEFAWVKGEELLSIGSDPSKDRIGVPQGGALSCLIANLLMDQVDKKVVDYDKSDLQFYARFCDDMVLLHPNKKICQKTLDIYSDELQKIKLLSHDFTEIKEYSNKFWSSKSKAPYKWAKFNRDESNKANVPWLSFVGYQVSSNLKIRVRRSSLKKEIEKQVRETGKVVTLIKTGKSFRISEKSIKHRVRQRLLSMSIGRKNIFEKDKQGQMCWTAGFRLLKDYNHLKFQPKYLDKKRGMNLARLDSHLNKMKETNRPEVNRKNIKLDKEPKYYGAPFSYFKQFK